MVQAATEVLHKEPIILMLNLHIRGMVEDLKYIRDSGGLGSIPNKYIFRRVCHLHESRDRDEIRFLTFYLIKDSKHKKIPMGYPRLFRNSGLVYAARNYMGSDTKMLKRNIRAAFGREKNIDMLNPAIDFFHNLEELIWSFLSIDDPFISAIKKLEPSQ